VYFSMRPPVKLRSKWLLTPDHFLGVVRFQWNRLRVTITAQRTPRPPCPSSSLTLVNSFATTLSQVWQQGRSRLRSKTATITNTWLRWIYSTLAKKTVMYLSHYCFSFRRIRFHIRWPPILTTGGHLYWLWI